MTDEGERQRDVILRRLFDHEQRSSAYLSGADIAESMGLSVSDVVYHLGVLEGEGYVELMRTLGGSQNVDAYLTSAGQQRVRERVRIASSAVNIGAVINTMSGTLQAVGTAINSELSQVVNDPVLLRQALDELGSQLIESVKEELPERDRATYMQAIEEFKAELNGPRNPARVRGLLRSLSLLGDIEGSLGLVTRVAPYIAAATTLVQGLGIA